MQRTQQSAWRAVHTFVRWGLQLAVWAGPGCQEGRPAAGFPHPHVATRSLTLRANTGVHPPPPPEDALPPQLAVEVGHGRHDDGQAPSIFSCRHRAARAGLLLGLRLRRSQLVCTRTGVPASSISACLWGPVPGPTRATAAGRTCCSVQACCQPCRRQGCGLSCPRSAQYDCAWGAWGPTTPPSCPAARAPQPPPAAAPPTRAHVQVLRLISRALLLLIHELRQRGRAGAGGGREPGDGGAGRQSLQHDVPNCPCARAGEHMNPVCTHP